LSPTARTTLRSIVILLHSSAVIHSNNGDRYEVRQGTGSARHDIRQSRDVDDRGLIARDTGDSSCERELFYVRTGES